MTAREPSVVRVCRAVPGAARCGLAALYDAFFEGCAHCLLKGRASCIGHPLCEEHGATFRLGQWNATMPGTLFDRQPVQVARIRSLPARGDGGAR